MTEQNYAELISQFKNGNEQAFNIIVQTYQKRLYWVIRRFVKDHDEVDDLLQEVFIKVYKGLKNFKSDSALFTWMYRIAVNHTFNELKRKKIRQFFSIDEMIDISNNEDTPLEVMEKDERRTMIEKAIEQLPNKQKKVFILRYYEDMPFKEISKLLTTSEGGLKANYFQALKKIGGIIKNEM